MPSPDAPVAVRVDATGLRCPLPLLRLKMALAGVAEGEVVEVLATDPGSLRDIAAFARIGGHGLLHQGEENGTFRHRVRKGGEAPGPC